MKYWNCYLNTGEKLDFGKKGTFLNQGEEFFSFRETYEGKPIAYVKVNCVCYLECVEDKDKH